MGVETNGKTSYSPGFSRAPPSCREANPNPSKAVIAGAAVAGLLTGSFAAHTESFLMRPDEKTFYEKLTEYLAEGFALSPLFALVRIGRTAAKRESE